MEKAGDKHTLLRACLKAACSSVQDSLAAKGSPCSNAAWAAHSCRALDLIAGSLCNKPCIFSQSVLGTHKAHRSNAILAGHAGARRAAAQSVHRTTGKTNRCKTCRCKTGRCKTCRCQICRCQTCRCKTVRCKTGAWKTGGCKTGRCKTECNMKHTQDHRQEHTMAVTGKIRNSSLEQYKSQLTQMTLEHQPSEVHMHKNLPASS